jgi:hypothetical protein
MVEKTIINVEAIDSTSIEELKMIFGQISFKSDIERYFFYTSDPIQKAKVFILCYRFLQSFDYILTENTKTENLKEVEILIKNTLEILYEPYYLCLQYVNRVDSNILYGKKQYELMLFKIINKEDKNIDKIIDFFSVISGKVSYRKMAKFKGIVLEGQSGKDFRAIMKEQEKEITDVDKLEDKLNKEEEKISESDIIPQESEIETENEAEITEEVNDINELQENNETEEENEESEKKKEFIEI